MSNAITEFEPLRLTEQGPVLIATIHRPEALNALNASVLRALSQLLTWIETKTTESEGATTGGGDSAAGPRVLILTGAGEKAFVAGADIKEFESMSPTAATEFAMQGQAVFRRLETLAIPVIAAVNGFALGGGLELALACDFILASENAKFGLPESTLGIMPGFGGTVRLPRLIGAARAREMAYSGSMIDTTQALAMGLVSRVTSAGDLIPTCIEIANTIAKRAAPLSVQAIKKSIHLGASLSETEAGRLEAELFGDLFASADKAEGVSAFIEKRKASFKGRAKS
jgi:enoyl-CoA hydratase